MEEDEIRQQRLLRTSKLELRRELSSNYSEKENLNLSFIYIEV